MKKKLKAVKRKARLVYAVIISDKYGEIIHHFNTQKEAQVFYEIIMGKHYEIVKA